MHATILYYLNPYLPGKGLSRLTTSFENPFRAISNYNDLDFSAREKNQMEDLYSYSYILKIVRRKTHILHDLFASSHLILICTTELFMFHLIISLCDFYHCDL